MEYPHFTEGAKLYLTNILRAANKEYVMDDILSELKSLSSLTSDVFGMTTVLAPNIRKLCVERTKKMINHFNNLKSIINLSHKIDPIAQKHIQDIAEFIAMSCAPGLFSAQKLGNYNDANFINNFIEASDDPSGRIQKIVSDILRNGEANMNKKNESTCFICNAVYFDTEEQYKISIFRRFRDEKLSKRCLGRIFINWYYENGPYLAKRVKSNKYLYIVSKKSLDRIYKIILNKF